jgi:hypothetical protein
VGYGHFLAEVHRFIQKKVFQHRNLAVFKSLLTLLELAEANLHEDSRA